MTVLFCIPNSQDWRGLITGHLNVLTFGRAYDEQTGPLLSTLEMGREIFNSMEMCDLKTSLDRIADALESLDEKAAQRLTWEEFIEDIETVFEVGSLLPSVLRAFFNLMPNLTAKLDFTPIALSVWEWWSRWLPITTALTAIATAQGIQAGAAVSQKVLGIVDTVISLFPILQTAFLGWKDIIVGDKNLWDDLIRPMIAIFMGEDETEPNPDESSALRPLVNVFNRTIVQATIDACCMGQPDLPNISSPGTVLSQDQPPTSPTDPPIDLTGEIEWLAGTSNDEKCRAAHYILNAIIGFLEVLPGYLTLESMSMALLTNAIVGSLLILTFPLGMAVFVMIGFAATLLTLTTGTAMALALNNILAAINANLPELVCAMREAPDSETAKADILAILDGEGLTDTELTVAGFLFNNLMLALLFYNTALFDTSTSSDECPCATTCESNTKSIVHGTGPSNPAIAGEYTSAFVAGPNCHYIQVTSLEENSIRFVSISGWSNCNPPDQFRIASSGDGTAGDLYSDDTFPTGQCFVAAPGDSLAFIFSGNGPFTIEIECC